MQTARIRKGHTPASAELGLKINLTIRDVTVKVKSLRHYIELYKCTSESIHKVKASPLSSIGRAARFVISRSGFDSQAGQLKITYCLSDETLNRGPV